MNTNFLIETTSLCAGRSAHKSCVVFSQLQCVDDQNYISLHIGPSLLYHEVLWNNFQWLLNMRGDSTPTTWSWVLKLLVSENVTHFVWLALHYSMPTLFFLLHREVFLTLMFTKRDVLFIYLIRRHCIKYK